MDRGDGIQNLQKMVQAAKMYYQEGLTQETIAKKLRTSRPAVSLLLAEARKTGVVSEAVRPEKMPGDPLRHPPGGCGAEDRGLASGQVCQQNDEKPYHGRHLMGRLLL